MKLFRWAISSTTFVLMLAAVLLFCGGAADALMLEIDLPQLATGADAVVEGTVVSQTSSWNAAHNNISTDVVISVSDNIKGSPAKGSRITITLPGGEVNGTRQWVSDVPGFSTGGKAIVFLKQAAEGKFKVHGLEQGKFAVETDVSGIEKVGALTVDKFKERVNLAVQGKPLPAIETTAPARDIARSSIQGKALSTVNSSPPAKDVVLSTITTVNPSTASAGTNTQVTITGSGFGSVRGTYGAYDNVEFYYKTSGGYNYYIEPDAYISWSDTQIVCTVPAHVVTNPEVYNGSASSGWVKMYLGSTFYPTTGGTPFTVTFSNGKAKWPGTNPTVNYYVKPLAALPSSLAAVQAAAQTWTDDPANFTFSYAGYTASSAMAVDGKNEILWNLIGDSSIIGWAQVISSGGVITECDIEFNTQFTWSTTGEAGKMDVQTIATHELGHWLFLRDLFGNQSGYPVDTAKVMYGRVALAQIKRTLNADDSAGIFDIYPSAPPAAPILVSPPTSFTVGGTSATFIWNTTAGATGYVLEVNSSPTWATGATQLFRGWVGGKGTTTYTVTGFPNDGTTYYWRVWAGNAYGWSNTADVTTNSSNFINSPPPAPTLISPLASATVVGTSVAFQWNTSAGATGYVLEVNSSPTWATGATQLFRGWVGGTGTSGYTVGGFPNDGTAYYWRVWAGNAGGWSNTANVNANSRNLINGTLPTAPTLIVPLNSVTVIGTSVTFQWNISAGATGYVLEVNSSPTWATGATQLFRGWVGGTGAASYTVNGLPNNGTVYYWRVWAGNVLGWSNTADVNTNSRNFMSGNPAAPPSAPTLVSPLNGATAAGTSVPFTWNTSPGATGYVLEVNSSPTWETATQLFRGWVGGTGTASYTVNGFPNNGMVYYWRVWAGNVLGWSNTADVNTNSRSFQNGTVPTLPAAPTLILPLNSATVAGASVTFQWNVSPGATGYVLEVNSSPTWETATQLFRGWVGGTGTTGYTVTGFPNNGTVYYWRVWAGNAYGWSNTADVNTNSRNFTNGP